MPFRMKKTLACGLVAAALFASGAARAALVTNGGFEKGDFTGWTTVLDPQWDSVNNVPFAVAEGSWAASFGGVGSSISQTVATVAGSTYKISFWLQLEEDFFSQVTPNSFSVSFGSVAGPAFSDAAKFDYKQFDFLVTATGATTDLTFNFSDEVAFWDLDSVQVSLPEPGSIALLAAAGLAGAAASRRRKSASTSD